MLAKHTPLLGTQLVLNCLPPCSGLKCQCTILQHTARKPSTAQNAQQWVAVSFSDSRIRTQATTVKSLKCTPLSSVQKAMEAWVRCAGSQWVCVSGAVL